MTRSSLTRREFTSRAAAALAGMAGAGCFKDSIGPTAADARLHARPASTTAIPPFGFQPLGLAAGRDGFTFVPDSFEPSGLSPLLVLLHGAGGSADQWADAALPAMVAGLGIVVLCPSSRDRTWDFNTVGWGPDVRFIDAALARTFQRCNIDPARVALGGFSDGASYALSLGVFNGDLFSALIGLSPGYLAAAGRNGTPRIFVAHGTSDTVLPIDGASRLIVNILRQRGYDVTYNEFDGGHLVTDAEQRQAATWFVPPPSVP